MDIELVIVVLGGVTADDGADVVGVLVRVEVVHVDEESCEGSH